jgi:PUA domain protein
MKHRRFLREKEATRLLNEFSQKLKATATELFTVQKPNVEVAETKDARVYFVNGQPTMAQQEDAVFPTLRSDRVLRRLARITVNMGAVSHICNGADVLAPGIVKTEGSFETGDYVVVIDERFQKPLAIGLALMDSASAKGLQRGKVAKNLHYVGDAVWNVVKNL